MEQPPYDARSVANLLLDLAENDPSINQPVTHIALQKLVYFAHGRFLIETQVPLVKGAFEAWRYGPVHPAIYDAFKEAGPHPIKSRATARDVFSGEKRPLPLPSHPLVREHLRDILRAYGKLSVGRLVDISHAPNGPWATIVNKAATSVALGMRIPDSITISQFKYQKISVEPRTRVGEPDEDTPFVGDRFS